jgi:hypothetical protein
MTLLLPSTRSLHTLGRVISTLAKVSKDTQTQECCSEKAVHIPYRDSKLTRILQDSLGGNAKTCLIATINPLLIFEDETINTLRFADRAHQVMTHAKINQIKAVSNQEVEKLQDEITRLKLILQEHGIRYSHDALPPQLMDKVQVFGKEAIKSYADYGFNVAPPFSSLSQDDRLSSGEVEVSQYRKNGHNQMIFSDRNRYSKTVTIRQTSDLQSNATCDKIVDVISSVAGLLEQLMRSHKILNTSRHQNIDDSQRNLSLSPIVSSTKDTTECQSSNTVTSNVLTSLLARRKRLKAVRATKET